MPDSAFPRHVAVIGGGRWARVIAGVLAKVAPEGTRLVVCSPSNPSGWADWKRDLGGPGLELSVAARLDAVAADRTIEFAVIARAARENAGTAVAMLEAGKSVLVEKPFATNSADAERVVTASRGRLCTTGLVLLFAPNLRRFAEAVRGHGDLWEVRIVWRDSANESRYGEAKNYDVTLNCLLDAFPHVWSLLRLVAPAAPLTAVEASCCDGGRHVTVRLRLGGADVQVDIARDSDRRERFLEVRGTWGYGFIDFSREPGRAEINHTLLDVSTGFSSPLANELNSVARRLTGPFAMDLCRVEHAIESIHFAEALLPQIRAGQREQVVLGLSPGATSVDHEAAAYGLRELVGASAPDLVTDADILRNIAYWAQGLVGDEAIPAAIRSNAEFRVLRETISGSAARAPDRLA